MDGIDNLDDGVDEQVHANFVKDRGTKRKKGSKIPKSESMKTPRYNSEQQSHLPPTASTDDVGVVLSLFHRIQNLMKIVDGSTVDQTQYETMPFIEEEVHDELTLKEYEKLEWIMKWDTDHNLDWNWWYVRLYFQEHRRHLVDRFQATLNRMEEQQGTPGETTDTLEAGRIADNPSEEQILRAKVAEMQEKIATLEATINRYEQPTRLAPDAATTKVFVTLRTFFF
jgi:hypothetical protein